MASDEREHEVQVRWLENVKAKRGSLFVWPISYTKAIQSALHNAFKDKKEKDGNSEKLRTET